MLGGLRHADLAIGGAFCLSQTKQANQISSLLIGKRPRLPTGLRGEACHVSVAFGDALWCFNETLAGSQAKTSSLARKSFSAVLLNF